MDCSASRYYLYRNRGLRTAVFPSNIMAEIFKLLIVMSFEPSFDAKKRY